MDAVTELARINTEIGDAETRGDRGWLDSILAPQLAFRRANGQTTDRAGYLENVRASDARKTDVLSVEICGNRAVVQCVVTMAGRCFHNLRLFVRDPDGWKLLGWANEPL